MNQILATSMPNDKKKNKNRGYKCGWNFYRIGISFL